MAKRPWLKSLFKNFNVYLRMWFDGVIFLCFEENLLMRLTQWFYDEFGFMLRGQPDHTMQFIKAIDAIILLWTYVFKRNPIEAINWEFIIVRKRVKVECLFLSFYFRSKPKLLFVSFCIGVIFATVHQKQKCLQRLLKN